MIEKRVSVLPAPGVIRRGSKYSSKGSWYDSNWIRWVEGSLQAREAPTSLASASVPTLTYIPRHIIRRNLGASAYSIIRENDATGHRVSVLNEGDGSVTKISQTTDPVPSITLEGLQRGDFFGDTYLYVEPVGYTGTLYQWPAALSPVVAATAVSGAPNCYGVVVTPERFAVVFTGTKDVAWADQESLSVWTAASTNQAGTFTLQTDGKLQTGLAARKETLLFTDRDVWAMVYVGGNAVYDFQKLGSNCGVAGPGAVSRVGDLFFWMSPDGEVFMYDGVVRPVDASPVQEFVLAIMGASTYVDLRCTAQLDTAHHEATFYFAASGEPSAYVSYDYVQQHWSVGHVGFTAAAPHTSIGFIWQILGTTSKLLLTLPDRTGAVANDTVVGTPYAETGGIDLGEGDTVIRLQKLVFDYTGGIAPTIYYAFDTTAAESSTSPTAAAEVDVRVTGRFFRFKIAANATQNWRLTGVKFGGIPGGSR